MMKNKEAQDLFDKIYIAECDKSYDPSKWERGFLDSIGENLDKGWDLSPKQADMLNKIYRKSQGA